MLIQESIDVEEYLQSRGIAYSPPNSKNVGRNSVGISCPFCNDHAYSGNNHLGIKLDTKQWNCWICGAGRNKHFLSLVVKLENCSYKQARELLKPFTHSDLSLLRTDSDTLLSSFKGQVNFPKESTETLMGMHKKYLESRGFDAEYVFDKYKLRCVGPISKKWKLSLIAPVYFHHRMISFVSADITRERQEKYKNLSVEESVLPIRNVLYNLNNAGPRVVVVEGLTDVWNIGDSAVGLFTKRASLQQLKILSKFDKVFVMLDSDALENNLINKVSPAEQLAYDLSALTDTEIIELDYGDPGDLKQDDVYALRKEIFGH